MQETFASGEARAPPRQPTICPRSNDYALEQESNVPYVEDINKADTFSTVQDPVAIVREDRAARHKRRARGNRVETGVGTSEEETRLPQPVPYVGAVNVCDEEDNNFETPTAARGGDAASNDDDDPEDDGGLTMLGSVFDASTWTKSQLEAALSLHSGNVTETIEAILSHCEGRDTCDPHAVLEKMEKEQLQSDELVDDERKMKGKNGAVEMIVKLGNRRRQ